MSPTALSARARRHTPCTACLAGLVVAALAAGGCGGGDAARGAPAARRVASPPALCGDLHARIVGRIDAAAATELSGLVLSRSQRGVLWTHNDSGDRPRVLAVGLDGRLLADVALTNADAFDWEDIAAGPDALYVGDIGDNLDQRESIVVYRVAEPRVRDGASPHATQARRIELRYPDAPHDAEALLRDPRSGALVVVTKRSTGRSGIYVASKPVPGTRTTMRHRGTLKLGAGETVTAGDVSADGRTIALRSYTTAFVWTRRAGESVAKALKRKPCVAGTGLLGEGQGEALALAADGHAFYTVPEGTRPAIRRYAPD